MGSARGRAPKEADRANAALPPVNPSLLEADPKDTGEEPSRAPDATWSGIPGEWAVSNEVVDDAQRPTCQYVRGDAREKRASRLREKLSVLLSSQEEAYMEEFHPVSRRVCPRLVVHRLQDAIFFSDDFVDHPG